MRDWWSEELCPVWPTHTHSHIPWSKAESRKQTNDLDVVKLKIRCLHPRLFPHITSPSFTAYRDRWWMISLWHPLSYENGCGIVPQFMCLHHLCKWRKCILDSGDLGQINADLKNAPMTTADVMRHLKYILYMNTIQKNTIHTWLHDWH